MSRIHPLHGSHPRLFGELCRVDSELPRAADVDPLLPFGAGLRMTAMQRLRSSASSNLTPKSSHSLLEVGWEAEQVAPECASPCLQFI